MSEKKGSENPLDVHILLPVCTELEIDIFLDILKCYVGHSKLPEAQFFEAFLSGMRGESFAVQIEDLTVSWEKLNSNEQRIRQFQLLGFWVIGNFPTLWRKMLGKTQQAPPRNGASGAGHTEIDADNIDGVLSSKMKIRVIKLCVKTSTLNKLNYFVKIPGCVGVKWSNEYKITRKMFTNDVDADFVDSCWEALSVGKFQMSSDVERQEHTVMYSCVTTAIDDVDDQQMDECEDVQPTTRPKRLCRQLSVDSESNNSDNGTVDENSRRRKIPNHNRSSVDNEPDPENDETNIGSTGSLRAIILHLRDDIGKLSESIKSKKDEEMAKMITSANELKIANENLIANRMGLEKNIEKQAAVIVALQKGIDANMILNDKYKSDMTACLESNQLLKTEMNRLSVKLAEAERVIAFKNNMENDFTAFKSKADNVVADLRKEIDANMIISEKYRNDLAASLEYNQQLIMKVECVSRKLAEAENEIVSNKAEVQKLNEVNECVKQQYQSDLSVSYKSNEQLTTEVERLERKLFETQTAAASNVTARNEITILRSKGEGIVAGLRSNIACLMEINSKLTEENEQLKLAVEKHAQHGDTATQTGESKNTNEPMNEMSSGDREHPLGPSLPDPEGIGYQKKTGEDTEDDVIVKNVRKNLNGLKFG